MAEVQIILEGDGVWPDLAAKQEAGTLVWLGLGNGVPPIQIGALAGGMTSGEPSVAIRLDLPDGRTVVAELSLRLFMAAAHAFAARYGDPSTMMATVEFGPDGTPTVRFR